MMDEIDWNHKWPEKSIKYAFIFVALMYAFWWLLSIIVYVASSGEWDWAGFYYNNFFLNIFWIGVVSTILAKIKTGIEKQQYLEMIKKEKIEEKQMKKEWENVQKKNIAKAKKSGNWWGTIVKCKSCDNSWEVRKKTGRPARCHTCGGQDLFIME